MTLRYDRYYTRGRTSQKQHQRAANEDAKRMERERAEREARTVPAPVVVPQK